LKSSRKTLWSAAGEHWRTSIKSSNGIASCSTGVSMYFGSAEPVDRDHLRRLKALIKRTRTPWLSDHLCWGSVDGTYSHDLLPMLYTFEAAEVTARKVREARDFLEVPNRRRKREQLRRVSHVGND